MGVAEKGAEAGTKDPRATRPAPSEAAFFRLGIAEYGLGNLAGENEKANEHYQRACRAFRRGLQIQPANTKLRHAIEMALGTASRAQRGKGSQEDDEINLTDDSISKKELRDKIMHLSFGKKYLTACRFCNGRDYATANNN